MKKRVLITGVDGFLGSVFRRHLEDHKSLFDVFGIVKTGKGSPDQRRIVCDLTDPRKLAAILSRTGPHYIFHLAGGRVSDRRALFEGTLRTTQILLGTLKDMGECRARIIIPGSAAEYGQLPRGVRKFRESMDPQPVSWYGFVKNLQTSLGLLYLSSGLEVVVPRLFNITGYGTPSTLALGRFARDIVCIERGGRPRALSTGFLDGKRDFLDVQDVCAGLLAVAQKGRTGEVYNVCSGKAYSVRDLLKKLISYSTVKDIRISEEKGNVSESFDSAGSNMKIAKETCWKPQVTISRSLKDTLQYYRETMPGQ
jgi:GDP-4-dehydro-6-deoxy-D-mannose reductase